jgi:glyoxylase-like metal-dependent hydrolase (beta-lactamase superfamily II)
MIPRMRASRRHAPDRQQVPGALFPGGVGNTQQDAARFDSLYAGVVAKIFDRLPDETWVYPGHGGDTTLGAERPHLQEWRERG